jgi:hypothetical protein
MPAALRRAQGSRWRIKRQLVEAGERERKRQQSLTRELCAMIDAAIAGFLIPATRARSCACREIAAPAVRNDRPCHDLARAWRTKMPAHGTMLPAMRIILVMSGRHAHFLVPLVGDVRHRDFGPGGKRGGPSYRQAARTSFKKTAPRNSFV